MRRVLAAIYTEPQYSIVGRLLAFAAQAVFGGPEERIEPIDGADQLGEHVNNPVAAADVRQLVGEYDAYAVVRPVIGEGGQEHNRTTDAPCDWDHPVRTSQELDRSPQTQGAR